jgi:hypothetical protein
MSEESKDYLIRRIKEVMRRPNEEQSIDDVLSLLLDIVEEL